MPVNGYRKEPRSFQYQAYKYSQYLAITLNGAAMTGTHTILLEHTKEFHEEGVEHNVNMPSMGLYPKTAYLTTTTDWLNKRSKEITSSFEKKLSDLWVNLYCDAQPEQSDSLKIGEYVNKCIKQKKYSIPVFVTNWYENQLGVSFREAVGLLGLTD